MQSRSRRRRVKMTNNPKAKLKTLYVMRILQDETDAEHGLSLRQIIERLNDYGIQAERKGLYRDIEALREFGFDIQTFQRNPVQYAIVRRDFTLSELMLLQVLDLAPVEGPHHEPEASSKRSRARAPGPPYTRAGQDNVEERLRVQLDRLAARRHEAQAQGGVHVLQVRTRWEALRYP